MKLPPCVHHHHPFIITIFISRSCSSSSQSLPHHQLFMDQPETSITIIIIFVIISGQKRSSSSSKSASLSASTSVQPQNSIATLLEPLQSHNALRPEPHSASAPCAVLLAGAPVKQEHVHREQGANSPMSVIVLLCFSTAIACFVLLMGILSQVWRPATMAGKLHRFIF